VKSFRQQGEVSLSMAGSLDDLANAQGRVGELDRAATSVEEVETMQATSKNDGLRAAAMNTRGDLAFYRGDMGKADQAYQSAQQLASRARQRLILMLSKLNLAKLAVATGRYSDALRQLQPLLNEKGTVTSNLALQIQLETAQAEIGARDYPRATQILDQELITAKRAGMRFALARIYYMMGTAARLNGSAERASEEYREAAQLLDVMRSDPGAENIQHCADFKAMYDEANRWKK
jgi:tetratricopeptide (TPR) repeat protein